MQGPRVVATVLTSPKAPLAGLVPGEADANQSGVDPPPLLAHWPAAEAAAAASDGIAAASGLAPDAQPIDAAGVVAVVNNPIFCSSPENGAAGEQRTGASSIQPPGSPCDTVSSFGNAEADDQSSDNDSDSDSDGEVESLCSDGDSENRDDRGGSWSDHHPVAMHSAPSAVGSTARFGGSSAFGRGEPTAWPLLCLSATTPQDGITHHSDCVCLEELLCTPWASGPPMRLRYCTLAGRRSPRGLTTLQQPPPLEQLAQLLQADVSQVLSSACSVSTLKTCLRQRHLKTLISVVVPTAAQTHEPAPGIEPF